MLSAPGPPGPTQTNNRHAHLSAASVLQSVFYKYDIPSPGCTTINRLPQVQLVGVCTSAECEDPHSNSNNSNKSATRYYVRTAARYT